MPEFNKITHYCVIGTGLKMSKGSQELNTSAAFFLSFSFFNITEAQNGTLKMLFQKKEGNRTVKY